MLAALILSAGESSRMGRPKALLPGPGGRTFVACVAGALGAAGLDDVVIVTGIHHEAIAAAVARDALPLHTRLVRNPRPERGQLSSIWVGMDAAVTASTAGLLVTLVDVPLVRPETIRQVVDAWRRTRAPIVRPAIGDRHGHPVIFDRSVFEQLRAAPLERGAKDVVRAHAGRIVNVPVGDEGCLVDVDTPEDYQRLRPTTPAVQEIESRAVERAGQSDTEAAE